jgi:transposase
MRRKRRACLGINYTIPVAEPAMSGQVLAVSEPHKRTLASWVRAGTTPQRVTRRARIVLLAAEGKSVRAIADAVGVSTRTVILWRRRYREHGPVALWRDAPGRGRKRAILPEAALRVHALVNTPHASGGRWTIRRLAIAAGVSRASVHRILRGADTVQVGVFTGFNAVS